LSHAISPPVAEKILGSWSKALPFIFDDLHEMASVALGLSSIHGSQPAVAAAEAPSSGSLAVYANIVKSSGASSATASPGQWQQPVSAPKSLLLHADVFGAGTFGVVFKAQIEGAPLALRHRRQGGCVIRFLSPRPRPCVPHNRQILARSLPSNAYCRTGGSRAASFRSRPGCRWGSICGCAGLNLRVRRAQCACAPATPFRVILAILAGRTPQHRRAEELLLPACEWVGGLTQ